MPELRCSLPFTPAPLLGPFRINAEQGTVVARQLEVAAPEDAGPGTRRALRIMVEKKDFTVEILRDRTKVSPGGVRPTLAQVDGATNALFGRLASASKMPTGDIGERAQRVLDTVFGNAGLSFLKLDTASRYVEVQKRLAIIEDAGLETEIDRLAGAGYLDAVKAAHESLGELLGLGSTPLTYNPTALADARADLAMAIMLYVLQLAAEVDPGSEASVLRFNAAVAPLIQYLAERGHRAADDEGDADPVTPTPSPTDGTPPATPAAA